MDLAGPIAGTLAGLVGVAGMAPYIRDTVRGATRPHPGTWLIWAVLSIVVLESQRADGASWSLVMAGTHVALNAAVVAIAVRAGAGGLTAADAALMAVAAGGVAGWLAFEAPVVATACVVVADLVAAAMMVPKAWRDPGSETPSTLVLASIGGTLAAVAVAVPEPALLLYPAYYAAVNGALALVILGRRGRLPARVPAPGPVAPAR
jgi:hypothetical protein